MRDHILWMDHPKGGWYGFRCDKGEIFGYQVDHVIDSYLLRMYIAENDEWLCIFVLDNKRKGRLMYTAEIVTNIVLKMLARMV